MFFRAPEEELDQAEAYPFMTPIFGEGVVFDAPPERRREMLHNQALRDKFMRGHAETIAAEVERMVAGWDGRRRDRPARLVRRAHDLHVVGVPDRHAGSATQLDGRFADAVPRPRAGHRRHRLRRPVRRHRELPPPRRGAGRARRAGAGDHGRPRAARRRRPRSDRDLLDVLMSIKEPDGTPRFDADNVTGMFISMMFAGHHTTSGTAAWTLIELLRHPEHLAAVVAELDGLYAEGAGGELPGAAGDAPARGGHQGGAAPAPAADPPAAGGQERRSRWRDVRIAAGQDGGGVAGGVEPPARGLPRPRRLRSRAATSTRREEDAANPWNWIPFGAGRHRCVGAPFAMMQLKAIFSVLLRDWTFELAQPPDTYRNDHSKMVVQLQQPCLRHATPSLVAA